MGKIIQQKVEFAAAPQEIYEMLMDAKKHGAFTGEKASMSRKVGGKITAYGGYITGTNLELEANRRIVQKWRCTEWAKNVFSIAVFELEPTKKGTRLTFVHVGVPDNDYQDKVTGWKESYWDKMKKALTGAKK